VGNRPSNPETEHLHPGWNFRRNYRSHHLLYDEFEAIEKPIIIAANGICLGAGVEMAVSCDFRFCTPDAEFGVPEVHLGMLAGSGGTSRLTRLVGPAWGKWMAMAGRRVGAAQAKQIGLVHDVFPIAGRHTYGDPFGAQRGGHVHEGQDVMADCGLPLLATGAGSVKFAGSQSLAGNYVVISAADGTADYVYMHLRDPALVHKGDAVTAGETIGFVGRTGDATACHLHFELWPAPGWYTGGRPVDPLPSLEAWDVAA